MGEPLTVGALLAALRERPCSDLWCVRCGALATRVGPTTHRVAAPWVAYCDACPPLESYAIGGGRPATAALLACAGPLDPTEATRVLLADGGIGLAPCVECGAVGERWQPTPGAATGQDWYCAAHDPGGTRESDQRAVARRLAGGGRG